MRPLISLTILRWMIGTGVMALAMTGAAGADSSEKLWAFRSPERPAAPRVRDQSWVRNAIDPFVLAKLEEAGINPAPEADRATLIRRATFDLIGLPPTPEEIDAFVTDHSPLAYEKVVERLLASPQYGERWATYWLDLVRFAESDGFKSDDPRPSAWRYRDYVIRSLNKDKPFDQFVREQLAGDELYPGDPDALVATAYNRHYPDEANAVNLEQRRQEILNDMTDTTAQVFLGLTVGCARCHDHKFDPIPQEDYYRLQAFFAAFDPRDFPIGSHEDIARYQQQLQDWEIKTADIRKRMTELEEPYRRQFKSGRKARFAKDYQEMFDLPPEKRTPLQQQLAAMVARQVRISDDEVAKTMKPEVRQHWDELVREMKVFIPLKPQLPGTMGLTDVGPQAPATFLLRRGNWEHKGSEVTPGFLSILDDQPATSASSSHNANTTGRRSILAQWLTRPEQPLVARVMVNRLWQHHFVRGIVGTPSDFGSQGDPPTHPELLDMLAREFMDHGWSLKAMHRLMMTSATYRQASRWDPAPAKIDPENHLLWRMNRRRLEGETLRDAILAVSGDLNLKAAGPSVFPELPAEMSAPADKWPVSKDLAERNRRSVYVFVKRNLRYPLFSTFDAPDANETCARRYVTTQAPQALMLLNDKLILEKADAFAARLLRDVGPDPGRIIDRGYRLAFGRLPDAEERQTLLAFLDREKPLYQTPKKGKPNQDMGDPALDGALRDLCHALLNLNEFLYLD